MVSYNGLALAGFYRLGRHLSSLDLSRGLYICLLEPLGRVLSFSIFRRVQYDKHPTTV